MSSSKVEVPVAEEVTHSIPSNDKQSGRSNQSRRGGRGSQQRRHQNRQASRNANGQDQINTIEKTALKMPLNIKWKPSYGLYAGTTGIGFRGYLWYVTAMLRRLRSVAQRPLAILLTPINIATYLKVSSHLLYVRLCCSQDDAQVAVAGLTLRGLLTEPEKRLSVGLSRSIPRALAYALSTFGYFKLDLQVIVPTLPPQTQVLPSLHSANFAAVIQYVADHVNRPVPQNARAAVTALSQVLPHFETADTHQFTAETAAFWTNITDADWEVFREINAASRAQSLNVDDFDVSAATGQPAQIVRFEDVTDPVGMSKFYCVRVLDETEISRALALRPGDDLAERGNCPDRFRLSFDVATLRGFDLPASAIEATLLSLVARDVPT